jgi:quercetin 2,3-dioxygenase
MITLCRAEDRRHLRRLKQDLWLTFDPRVGEAPLPDGFGALEMLNEDRLSGGARVPLRPDRAAEILTYVLEGAVAHEDSRGSSGVIHAGEFQRIHAGPRLRHSQTNASRTEAAHVFHIWLRAAHAEFDPSNVQKRFCAADRRGVLCAVASPDGRNGSLRIHVDASIYSAMLDPGQHLVHALEPKRGAWLHVVRGQVRLGDVVLNTGDAAGVTADRAVSITACQPTEILLLDLLE